MDRKNKFGGVLEVIPAIMATITAVIMAGYFKMGFWGTFFSALLAGLVLLFITWILKNINRKKLHIMIITERKAYGKFKFTVLIWNRSWLNTVYNSDYGERGLGLVTDYDAVIAKLGKPDKIKWTKNFSFSKIPDTAPNTLNLHMGDLPSRALIEFDFEVQKSETAKSDSVIVLPSNTKTSDELKYTPCLSLHYDRTNLNIRELKYKKSVQILHWICRYAIVLTVIGTTLALIVFGFAEKIVFIGAMFSSVFLSATVSVGDFIPPFVVKHMKDKGYR